jgi:hypothetical protein
MGTQARMSADAALALLVRANEHLFAIAVARVQSVTLLRDAELVPPSAEGGQPRLVRPTGTIPIYSLLTLLGLEESPWAAIVVLSDTSDSAASTNAAAPKGASRTAESHGTPSRGTAIAIAVGKCEVVRSVERLMALPFGAFVQAVPAITHVVATATSERSELAYWLSCDRLQELARIDLQLPALADGVSQRNDVGASRR